MNEEIIQHIKRLSAYEYSLINTICDTTGIDFSDLVGQKRHRKFVNARKIASYLFQKKGYTYENIGQIISIIPKDHTTIIYHLKSAINHYNCEPHFKFMVDSVINNLSKQNFTSLKYKPCKILTNL